MAEFTDVVKQVKRMCAEFGNDCAGCGLADSHCPLGPIPENWDGVDFAKVERIVMDWAAKNPVTRYPAWYEWQKTTFPDSAISICPKTFMSHKAAECNRDKNCSRCIEQPIPADIAEKLGIKPIGGANDENA